MKSFLDTVDVNNLTSSEQIIYQYFKDLETKIKALDFNISIPEIKSNVDSSTSSLGNEASEFNNIASEANSAADAKNKFAAANKQAGTENHSKSIIAYSIDDEGGNTTGIDEMEFSAPVVRQAQQNVYSLNGQMIRKGVSTVGLPKGIYIVGGKKLIVK